MKPIDAADFAAPITYAPISHISSQKAAQVQADRYVQDHMGLVRKIAWHVHGRVANSIDVEDLIQIGLVALVEAARSYEDRGHAFATYASMRIRGSMIDALRKSAAIARSAMVQKRALSAARNQLQSRLGRSPTAPEMAEAMGLSIPDYQAAVDTCADVRHESMDEVYSDHSIWFADQGEAADSAIERSQMQAALASAIGQLPEREAMVLQLYFVEELNLHEIGAAMDIGAARVCQIKKSATDKLRVLLADVAGD
jgi:RNA polymerase sigma factor FliA